MSKAKIFITCIPSLEEIKQHNLSECVVFLSVYTDRKPIPGLDSIEFPNARYVGDIIQIKELVKIKDYDRWYDLFTFMQENILEHNCLGDLVYRKMNSNVSKTYFKLLDTLKINTKI